MNHESSFVNPRPPPLNALRAFEAAARHLSFKKAADELHVTPGAISQQIKALEEHLGVPLFVRLTRALELTEAAQVGLPKLREGFACLGEAVERVRGGESTGVLTLNVAPAFAARWLVGRLPRFADAHPEIELNISASLDLIDVLRGVPRAEPEAGEAAAGDLTIRFGTGRYPGFRVDRLIHDVVTPICSPRLLRGRYPLTQPQALRRHTLLHDNTVYLDDTRPDWAVWLEAAGIEGIDVARGLRFDHAALALEAAAEGLGVALSMPTLAQADLAAGRLVRPFELSLPSDYAYYLVCAGASAERPKIAAFRRWLLAEVAAGS